MEPTRVEILDDNGEWRPLHGITNIVIYDDPEIARAVTEQIRKVQDAMTAFMQAYVEALTPAVQRAVATLAEAVRATRAAGLIDEQGNPVKRDRPAWKSPYEPVQRRR